MPNLKRIVFQPRYSADPIQVRSLPEPPKKKIKHFIVNKGGDGNFYMTKGCTFRKLSLLIDYYQVGKLSSTPGVTNLGYPFYCGCLRVLN